MFNRHYMKQLVERAEQLADGAEQLPDGGRGAVGLDGLRVGPLLDEDESAAVALVQ